MSTETCSITGYEIPAETHPLADDIKVFLDVFDALSAFEAESQFTRGYGISLPSVKRPAPEVVRVLAWLKSLTVEATL